MERYYFYSNAFAFTSRECPPHPNIALPASCANASTCPELKSSLHALPHGNSFVTENLHLRHRLARNGPVKDAPLARQSGIGVNA